MLTKFEVENLDEFERELYKRIIKQVKEDPYIKWGESLNAIIISDRCPGRAHGIFDYLVQKTNIDSTVIFKHFYEVKGYIEILVPDIVIFVGYQEDKINYDIIEEIRKIKPDALILMNAFIDEVTEIACESNDIFLMYDSFNPMQEFVQFMRVNLAKIKQ